METFLIFAEVHALRIDKYSVRVENNRWSDREIEYVEIVTVDGLWLFEHAALCYSRR